MSKVKTVSFWGMYDGMAFTKHNGNCLLNVVFNWIYHNSSPNFAIVDNGKLIDLGPTDLCPARVIYENGTERSVGIFVSWKNWHYVYKWLELVRADNEITNHLLESKFKYELTKN